MNGADLLCEALLGCGVDTCFVNPGTSEMHFVAALDRQPGMRCILGLFEGVVTGAADGYARMTDRPAATLLHLGPGLTNGLANIHNARRARSPMINVVGDYNDEHRRLDAPLASDIVALAAPLSDWVRRVEHADHIGRDVAEAWRASMRPGIATLVVPADATWSIPSPQAAAFAPPSPDERPSVEARQIDKICAMLRAGRKVAFLLSGPALRQKPLDLVHRISQATGAKYLAQGANGRIERGRGRVGIERLPFAFALGAPMLNEMEAVVLIGAAEPVTFFPYPGQPARLSRPDCEIVPLVRSDQDPLPVLQAIVEGVGAGSGGSLAPTTADPLPLRVGNDDDRLTVADVNAALAAALPEQAIVCDEVITSGGFYQSSYRSAPHDYLQITGGAIGIGMPMTVGAAVACPDRKVIGLQADGSGMYTLQALWTMARENLDILTIIFANRAYAILQGEMKKVGADRPGRSARRMLYIDEPQLNWAAMAIGMGVEAVRANTVGDFLGALKRGLAARGPFLIEAMVDKPAMPA